MPPPCLSKRGCREIQECQGFIHLRITSDTGAKLEKGGHEKPYPREARASKPTRTRYSFPRTRTKLGKRGAPDVGFNSW